MKTASKVTLFFNNKRARGRPWTHFGGMDTRSDLSFWAAHPDKKLLCQTRCRLFSTLDSGIIYPPLPDLSAASGTFHSVPGTLTGMWMTLIFSPVVLCGMKWSLLSNVPCNEPWFSWRMLGEWFQERLYQECWYLLRWWRGNHSFTAGLLHDLVMLWRSQCSIFYTSLWSSKKKKRSRHDTLWNAEFPAVPRCCCADVPRGDVQRIHYLLVNVSLITLVQILFKSPFEQQMIPATDSFGAARPFLTPLLMPYD